MVQGTVYQHILRVIATLSECCTEVNEVLPATSEMVLVAQKMTKLDNMQTELVIGSLFIQCKLSFHPCC